MEVEECGCKFTSLTVVGGTEGSPIVQHEPCLMHAFECAGQFLLQAGNMLTEAARRMHKQQEPEEDAGPEFIQGSEG